MKQILFGLLILVLGAGFILLLKNLPKTTGKIGSTFILGAQTQNTTSPDQITPTPDMSPQSFSTKAFSLLYPSNWHVYTFPDASSCVDFSDIPNPQDIPVIVLPDSHSVIQVSFIPGPLPTRFSEGTRTLTPITIHGYSGMKRTYTTTLGIAIGVYLTNPNGGHAELIKEIGNESIFDHLLQSFTFGK